MSQAAAVVTPRGRERWRVALAATAVLVGVGLVVDPLGWRDLVAVVGGGGLFVTGVVIAYRGVRTPSGTARLTAAAQSSLFLTSGAVVLVLPGPFLALLLCLVTGWVVIQVLLRTGVRLGLTQVPAGERGRNILLGWTSRPRCPPSPSPWCPHTRSWRCPPRRGTGPMHEGRCCCSSPTSSPSSSWGGGVLVLTGVAPLARVADDPQWIPRERRLISAGG